MHLNKFTIAFPTASLSLNLYNQPSCFLVCSSDGCRSDPSHTFDARNLPFFPMLGLTHYPYLAASCTHDRKYSYLRRPVAAYHNNDSPCIIIEPTPTRVFPPSIALLVLPLIPTALLIVYLTAAVYNSHIHTSFLRLTCPWDGSFD